ncbi:MAG: methylmalonyl Co-A mutase-associated GTPase MeaB [Desulfatibacillaceae bacterium]
MSDDKPRRPEWVEEGKEGFASSYLEGGKAEKNRISCAGGVDSPKTPKRRNLTVEDYVEGVGRGDRTVLARAITLVESNSPTHIETAQAMLRELLPKTGNSMRVGITGVPGAGKSTFIEALGTFLCEQGHKVAVLAVDPTSSVTRGSILGDKTRMAGLSRHPNAFIRPSPSGGVLGGVARKSRETMLVCEAAGYDVILVETVGVGQSETTVRSMVDFFLLVLIAGAGDELQGMKRGIMELCDAILVNKADGDNKPRAEAARQELDRILHYLRPATEGWETHAYTCSALMGTGIEEIWDVIREFRKVCTDSGVLEKRRRDQIVEWVHTMLQQYLMNRFSAHEGVRQMLPEVEQAVADGDMAATAAVRKLVAVYEGGGDGRE